MFSKKDIYKLAKKILRRQNGLRDHQMIHPVREWFLGLSIGFSCLLVGGVWSFVTYGHVSERDVANTNVAEIQQTVYREEMVTTALEQFRARSENFQILSDTTIETPPAETNTPALVDTEPVEEIVPVPEDVESIPANDGEEQSVDTDPSTIDDSETSDTSESVPPEPPAEPTTVEPVSIDIN